MVVREQLDHQKRADLTSLLIWRKNFTEFSIQDIHQINHLRGGKGPHNSQWHKLENDTIDPYLQLFKSLAAFFHELDTEKNFLYITSEKLRTRCKNAQPYLTHDGRVPTMIDLIEIFEGIQPVNKLYLEANALTAEEIENYRKLCCNYFQDIKRSEMLEPKDAWQSFVNQPYAKTISKNDLAIINDLLRGEIPLTLEIMIKMGETYGKCPMLPPLQSMSNIPVPKELKMANQRLESFVAYELQNGKSKNRKLYTF